MEGISKDITVTSLEKFNPQMDPNTQLYWCPTALEIFIFLLNKDLSSQKDIL